MKLPIQAKPVLKKVSTAKLLDSMLVQPLYRSCSEMGDLCLNDSSCCNGLKCSSGLCKREKVSNIPNHPIS
jgi:hypothetical protein